MKNVSPIAVAALVASLAVACSPADVGGGADGGSSGPAVTQACRDYSYAECTRLQSCSALVLQVRYATIATCEAIYNAQCIARLTASQSGSTADSAEACAKAIPSWVCSDFYFSQNPPPGCGNIVGPLPNGSACSVDGQCQSSYCGEAPGAACGVCGVAPAAGGSCATTECPSGLVCEAPQMTCEIHAPVGQPCNSTAPCGSGLNCVGATSTSSGTCQAAVQTEGASCSYTTTGCDFYSDLTCNAQSATCVTPSLVQAGQACGTVDNQSAYCIAGTCNHGACVANASTGGACDLVNGPQCFDNTRCVVTADGGTAGTCITRGSVACR